MSKLKEWFRETIWVYPAEDEQVLKVVEKTLVDYGFLNYSVYQHEFPAGKYPQYLCSVDLGIGGDKVHFWRDGQTWWPVCGDYDIEQEEKAELSLREALKKYMEAKNK